MSAKERKRREAGRSLLGFSKKRGKRKPLTMQESLIIDLVFEHIGESRCDRTFEEYDAIAANLPPIKVLHGIVNDRLRELAQNPPHQFCYFQAGDRRAWYKDFPSWLSIEVVRRALVNFGLRKSQIRRPRKR
jgi:hypothetical protein